ncbi:hypothetical protein L4F91_01765 [Avibacterium sp. 20-126]|uniref:hypothetical protein n=1 Tax=Avibacterium sp. 20-126 TaxID=2911524 RepID=UPI0021897A19|nr:hypothetical protein L4F91_01765 [Avibacterium sp. 20-126]
MMMLLFNNPHNLLGKFAQLSTFKQYAILLICTFLPLFFLVIEYQQAQQQNAQTARQIVQLTQDLDHQKQILSSLQQSKQRSFTPELTRDIAEINQALRPQDFQLQVKNSQWHFYQAPYLTMQLAGKFEHLRQFLTALLDRTPQLNVLQLHIYKTQENPLSQRSLITEVRFKLSLYKDKQ